MPEMKLFLGCMLQMGPCSFPSLDAYRKKSRLYEINLWSSIMSRNRFQLLLRFLHFADNSVDSDEKLYKIRPILDHFNNVMEKNVYG